MLSLNQKIRPYSGDAIQGGKYTRYQVLDRKHVGNGIYVNTGWVTLIAEGNHPCEPKSGAQFKITEITGVGLDEYPTGSKKYKPTIFAKIEWPTRANRNQEHLDDDIPEDL